MAISSNAPTSRWTNHKSCCAGTKRTNNRLAAAGIILVALMALAASNGNVGTALAAGHSEISGGHLDQRSGEYSQPMMIPSNTDPASSSSSSAVALYREPSGWLVSILKEFFSDIDWDAIAVAREQIVKFVRKVDRLVSTFRANSGGGGANQQNTRATNGEGRLFASWWGSSGAASSPAMPAGKPGDDSAAVRSMLERVACFMGYVRLMNLSNEALAELDASQVVSNLFGAGGANKSSSGGYFSNWFG